LRFKIKFFFVKNCCKVGKQQGNNVSIQKIIFFQLRIPCRRNLHNVSVIFGTKWIMCYYVEWINLTFNITYLNIISEILFQNRNINTIKGCFWNFSDFNNSEFPTPSWILLLLLQFSDKLIQCRLDSNIKVHRYHSDSTLIVLSYYSYSTRVALRNYFLR